jgi:predicted dienelactone hydrolase
MTDANQRPIALDLWFPAEGVAETEHNYGISKGSVATGASIAGDHLPIVLLSHGAMGAAVNYSWIAETLARRGYVVLGVSHFGESPAFGPSTINPINVSHFGDRTRDFKAGLAYLLSQPGYASHLNADRLGLLGHSSGGTTVMMLAGGKFLPADIAAYCRTDAAKGDKSCSYPTAGAMDPKQAPETLDRHVSAVVALDPALGMGFSKEALASVTAPVLVIGSEQNDFLHFDTHAGRLMGLLPSAERVTLQGGEGHFIYVNVCDVSIQALGVPLCKDRAGVDRAKVHERLSATIVAFFDKTLRTKK